MLRIVKSLLIIVAVAAIATTATGAYFSSATAISGNSFATGVLALQVNGGSGSAVFSEANLAPGNTIAEKTFQIANTGNLSANHLDLEVTLTGDTVLAPYIVFSGNTDGLRFGSTKAGDKSVLLNVPGWTAGDSEYGVTNGLTGALLTGPNANAPLVTGPGQGMDRDSDGKVTLADLAAGKVRISANGVNDGIAAGTSATLWLNAKVDPATPDALQGKSVVATFTWTLHQDASQF